MIASLILLIVSGGFVASYLAAIKSHRASSRYYTGLLVARNRIQRATTHSYDSLPMLAEDSVRVDGFGMEVSTGLWERTTLIDTNFLPQVTRISVEVKFTTIYGDLSEKPVTVTTMRVEEMH